MILQTMLNRLHASLVHGPSINARPHRSRQRIDLLELAAFQGREMQGLLAELLEKGSVEIPARVPRFEAPEAPEAPDAEWTPAPGPGRCAFLRRA